MKDEGKGEGIRREEAEHLAMAQEYLLTGRPCFRLTMVPWEGDGMAFVWFNDWAAPERVNLWHLGNTWPEIKAKLLKRAEARVRK